MAGSFNRVILVGNCTRDIEVRQVGETSVADVGLAVNDKRKDKQGNWVEEVTFVDITLWGRQAEIAGEYLHKGSCILVEGRLKLETWEDKKSGDKRSKLKVVGESMRMLDGKPKEGGGSGGGQRSSGGGQRSGGVGGGSRQQGGGREHDDSTPWDE